MQLSGDAAQEELERFADVRAAALLLPVTRTSSSICRSFHRVPAF